MSAKTLAEIRAEIDAIDAQLIALLDRRFSLALETGPLKAGQLRDADRERQLLAAIQAFDAPNLSPEFRDSLLRLILAESRRLQAESDTP